MRQRTVVAVSLLYVGVLVALSRRWLGDVRDFVVKATHPDTSTRPTTTAGPTRLT